MSRGQDKSLDFGMGILFGVLAGVAAGIIFAPKSGEETRKVIKDKIEDVAKSEFADVNHYKNTSLETLNKVTYTVEKQINKINEAIKAGKMAAAKKKEELESDYSL